MKIYYCPKCKSVYIEMYQEENPMREVIQLWHCIKCNHRWSEKE